VCACMLNRPLNWFYKNRPSYLIISTNVACHTKNVQDFCIQVVKASGMQAFLEAIFHKSA